MRNPESIRSLPVSASGTLRPWGKSQHPRPLLSCHPMWTRRRIDRGSPVPYYHQLKQILLEAITRQQLGPGDRVPGDNELIRAFDVSRTVVRQALTELEFEGYIERHKGRGTFVSG